MNHTEYMRQYRSRLQIGICLSCGNKRKIYHKSKQLCQYCWMGDYYRKYQKENQDLRWEWKKRWIRKSGKTSNYYNHKCHFSGNRDLALERDNCKCVKCGITREEHYNKYGRDISVDHIKGIGAYDIGGGGRNELSNLQTLCLVCHIRKTMVI